MPDGLPALPSGVGLAPPARSAPGLERAAALLLALGPEASAAVLRALPPAAVEGLAMSSRALLMAPQDIIDTAAREFVSEMKSYGTGPLTRHVALKEIMESALGEQGAKALEPPPPPQHEAVQSLADAEADDIALLLRKEQVPTIALVLCMLPSDKAAAVLGRLPETMKGPLLRTLFSISQVSPELIDDVLHGLADQLKRFVRDGKRQKVDGNAAGVAILRSMKPEDQRVAVGELAQSDARLADSIRGKLVSFDDVANMSRQGIQVFLQSVNTKTLALALKGVGESVVEKILANMSQRAAASFREEMEGLGRVRLSQVEAAQSELVKLALDLAEAGKIQLSGQQEKML